MRARTQWRLLTESVANSEIGTQLGEEFTQIGNSFGTAAESIIGWISDIVTAALGVDDELNPDEPTPTFDQTTTAIEQTAQQVTARLGFNQNVQQGAGLATRGLGLILDAPPQVTRQEQSLAFLDAFLEANRIVNQDQPVNLIIGEDQIDAVIDRSNRRQFIN